MNQQVVSGFLIALMMTSSMAQQRDRDDTAPYSAREVASINTGTSGLGMASAPRRPGDSDPDAGPDIVTGLVKAVPPPPYPMVGQMGYGAVGPPAYPGPAFYGGWPGMAMSNPMIPVYGQRYPGYGPMEEGMGLMGQMGGGMGPMGGGMEPQAGGIGPQGGGMEQMGGSMGLMGGGGMEQMGGGGMGPMGGWGMGPMSGGMQQMGQGMEPQGGSMGPMGGGRGQMGGGTVPMGGVMGPLGGGMEQMGAGLGLQGGGMGDAFSNGYPPWKEYVMNTYGK